MKQTIIALAAILLLAACAKEQVAVPEESTPKERVMSFTASLESATRAFDESTPGSFKWEANDAIAVPFRTVDNDLVYLSFTTNGNGEFSHVFAEGEDYELVVDGNAYYPFSAVNGTDQITLDGTVIPLVAQVGSDQTLAFKHLAAFMDMTFTGLPVAVSEIKVTGVHAGPYSVSYNGGNPSLTAVNDAGTDYYSIPVTGEGACHATVSFAPGTYNSLTFNLLTANGTVVYSKSTSQNLERKKYYAMPALAYIAATKFYVTTSSSTHYWDKTNVPLIQIGSSNYELWMNCDGGTTISIYDEYGIGQGGTPLWTGTVNDGNYYKISWDSASATGSVAWVSATQNLPWGIQSFENLAIYCDFSGAWAETKLSYNGNHSWSYLFTVSTTGTYSFKIKIFGEGWNDQWGYYSGDANSKNPGSDGYGTAVKDSRCSDMTVYLTAGTYQVNVNSIQPTYSDKPLRVMFVKQ